MNLLGSVMKRGHSTEKCKCGNNRGAKIPEPAHQHFFLVKLKALKEQSPFDGQEEGILQTDCLSKRGLKAHAKLELCRSSSAKSH